MYYLGVDGGGTKTHCVIADEYGHIISEGFGAGSNHQVVGPEEAKTAIDSAVRFALSKAELRLADIDFAVLGLSGADLDDDFIILNHIVRSILKDVPFKIINDTWIALQAGNKEFWGIVSICGTGANCAGKTRSGNEFILRALSYEYGNFGGGGDIARDALHYAFRSEEGTYKKTLLEKRLPQILDVKDLRTLIRNSDAERKAGDVPKLVFELADENDEVCQEILIKQGKILGEMAGGVIKNLQLEKTAVPVVLAGSVFKGTNPLLIDSYILTVHQTAPKAKVKVLDKCPVMGAIELAKVYHQTQQ